MKIIGIDPGTARMGYSILDVCGEDAPQMIETDVIITQADEEMHNRLKRLYNEINIILTKYKPEVMIVEKLFFNTNVKTAMTVGQARGVVMLAAAGKRMPLYEYTALQAKLALTGYGRSDKKQMQEAVKECLHLESIIKSDDANDALAIALCFLKKDFQSYLKGEKNDVVVKTKKHR